MPLAGASEAAPIALLLSLALLGSSCCAAARRQQPPLPPPAAHTAKPPLAELQEFSVRQLPEAVDFAPAEAAVHKEEVSGGGSGVPEAKQRLVAVAAASEGEAKAAADAAHAQITTWLGAYRRQRELAAKVGGRRAAGGAAGMTTAATPGVVGGASQQQQQQQPAATAATLPIPPGLRVGPHPTFTYYPLHRQHQCQQLGRRARGGHSPPAAPRRNLVLAAVGDSFDAADWMDHPDSATYDIVVVYYGASNATVDCPLCKAVFYSQGPKWQIVHTLSKQPEWRELSAGHRAVMLPDDDLILNTCILNRAFELFHAFKLLIAQPSLCDTYWVTTQWRLLYQSPEHVLRMTTFIEIMAPMFEMDFFNSFVAPSLYNAYTGWGLDFVWPFLLGYPRDKVAVLDDVCMFHAADRRSGGASIYSAAAPYDSREEERRRLAEWGYTAEATQRLGVPYRAVEPLAVVPRPALRQGGFLERLELAMREHLGALYPAVVLAQTGVLLAAGARLAVRRIGRWRRWQGRPSKHV